MEGGCGWGGVVMDRFGGCRRWMETGESEKNGRGGLGVAAS